MCLQRSDEAIRGVILKGIGGFYYVAAGENIYECRARGRFRKDGITPLPGDRVEISPGQGNIGGYVEEIEERKNQLLRPAVANVDQLMVILSAAKPKPDFLLADKLAIYAAREGIDVILGINKCDAAEPENWKDIAEQYGKAAKEICIFSAKTGEGIGRVKQALKEKCSCLAGQSAVGKSSLLNALLPELHLETGGLAKKTARGRHTTRHAELIPIPELKAVVVDTPGFSILEAMELEPAELGRYYPEFIPFLDGCRFRECLHDAEPECGVKQALEKGEIHPKRYGRYLELLNQLKERKAKRYD